MVNVTRSMLNPFPVPAHGEAGARRVSAMIGDSAGVATLLAKSDFRRREQPLRGARGRHLPLRRNAALQGQFQHERPHARTARAERQYGSTGLEGEIFGAHVSEATALWLQTMAVLAQGDTVELQGTFRSADGYFAADHTSSWGCKLG
jgi:hypothetical protein